ncbi:NAD(P)H-quinone oxidoreductase [Caenimonas aquaedulcis]|uniref:NAD(P)H-quinone oxidoreductase n=1 Tax=Caenimonas aquaedulcis TaxID=2793270 RepID=A0A931H864_9BURK|nr:NAD(P)H-quinone oxidoreductase [Caenimonas aquaedulcis]MBG9390501.1 NAD(P)H-quinone oxidoreductase [Caenimonas aquaedulcis]
MLVIDIPRTGGPEVLTPADRPIPEPGPGEVLIRVVAAGVNRPDLMQRAGVYPMPPGAPTVPGLEVAGEVAALGPGVERWRKGDTLCALLIGGGYAEYVVAPQGQCMPIPQGLDMAEAAALPEGAFTAWSALLEHGRLQSGERLLVHGGTSGVGSLAMQWARRLGAQVFATAGSAEKCAASLELGAHVAINYREQAFESVIEERTAGHGVDVILDMVGAPYFARNLAVIARDGRMVYIAHPLGRELTVDIGVVMMKRAYITGTTLRHRTLDQKAVIARELERVLWPLIEEGAIRPRVHRTFALRDAAQAHIHLDSNDNIGKTVLTVADA